MNANAYSHTMKNRAIAFLLIGLFTILSPIFFLSQIHDGESSISDMPHQVIRVGQPFVGIVLSDVSSAAEQKGIQKIQVNDSRFVVELPYSVTYDELEAIVDTIASAKVQQTYSGSVRLRFDGWSPSFLPLRIPYRYFLTIGIALFLVGAGLFFRRSRKELEE